MLEIKKKKSVRNENLFKNIFVEFLYPDEGLDIYEIASILPTSENGRLYFKSTNNGFLANSFKRVKFISSLLPSPSYFERCSFAFEGSSELKTYSAKSIEYKFTKSQNPPPYPLPDWLIPCL
ncbi:MAG: hypothetical protein IPH04_11780 [Saprospirales bacterium]|nr:hypothetical protein [Saprospirales bacterium]